MDQYIGTHQCPTPFCVDARTCYMTGTADAEYLAVLEAALQRAKAEFQPDVILYNAGARHLVLVALLYTHQ